MIIAILIIACLILIALIFGLYVLNNKKDPSSEMALDSIKKLENSITVISTRLDEMDKSNFKLNQLVDSRLGQYSNDSNKLVTTIENKLADIQKTVDEKLQTTLESRISSSFKQVGERLESVYKQLGEMQNLSQGVGNLQRVLTNVKTRGIWGELQAERILQEILVPEQYEKNVVTKKGSRDAVEFAIKLPGSLEGQCVYLPIDSKFPREDYEKLCMATEEADTEQIKNLKRALERRIVLEAQTIRDKYIDVPNTTDFAVMFLPIEGLYAEVLSIAGLQDKLQHECHIMIAGPTTLASLLNSLQMGFRTLAIEKKSSEVWQVLGEVKTEYAKFGLSLETIKRHLASATNDIDDAFVRHRAMGRKLKNVEAVETSELSGLIEVDEV